MKNRLLNILFWSVISAAFIGPGTITTASKAGADFGFDLLWTLVFSTLACLVLQEAAARLAILSGTSLGGAISIYFKSRSMRFTAVVLVIGAIIIGSAAYEAGNIMGAVAGLDFIVSVRPVYSVPLIGVIACLALTLPTVKRVAQLLGIIVAVMGASFFLTAIKLQPSFPGILKGSLLPLVPDSPGAGLLILGLIGTTVVPYNLFLGSGIAGKDQHVREMRFGLTIAVVLGGLISMSVLVVGSFVQGGFSYSSLLTTLGAKLGAWSGIVFGIGMFAAGLSSAITAPFASAITARSLFSGAEPGSWGSASLKFRFVWGMVLLTGMVFGLSGLKPVPVIILAQALNGIILPFISVFLVIVINDPSVMGTKDLNGKFSNASMFAVVWVTLMLGITNLSRALSGVFPSWRGLAAGNYTVLYAVLSTAVWIFVLSVVLRNRRGSRTG